MSHVRRAVACIVTSTAALFVFALPAGSVPPASVTSAGAAVEWLKTQQEVDGGFELANFGGFETLDASIAIAEDAQSGGSWDQAAARAAVEAVQFGGAGATPFDAIDGYAETIPTLGIVSAGTAAKNIVLGAIAYGFDPTAFDPAGDGNPVDLVSLMGGCSAAGDPVFNLALYEILAQSLVCSGPPTAALQDVRDKQRADGGWNYLGDFDPAVDSDADTTALAIEALVAGGADSSDPTVHAALAFFAANHQEDGAWQSFGADDPNSTAVAIFAITAAGFDVESPCWRDTADPSLTGTAYASPTAWIVTQQQADGRIASPNDAFGPINTFATSQSVEALLQSWLPVARASAQACETPIVPPEPPTQVGGETVTPIVPVAIDVSPRFTG